MLNGSLDSFALPDVLRFVAGSGVTGRIEITREEVGGELSLDRGRYVAARLHDEEAPSTVDEALDVCVLLFDGSSGSFEVLTEDWVGGPLDLDADELNAAVERRREEWAEVVSVLGSLEEPLVLAAELPEGTERITLTADQWRLLALVDGSRSVQDIAHDSASSVYMTAVLLAEMANNGLVAPGAGVAWKPAEKATKQASKKRPAPKKPQVEDDPAELLHELAEDEEALDDDDDQDGDGDQEEATVRPLRPPTREEQRLRLRR